MSSITPLPGKPGHYAVCTGGGTYEVERQSGRCTCPSSTYRTPVTGRVCKHWLALQAHLDQQSRCPACQGSGRVALRDRYPGPDPVCAVCGGSGRRESADPALLAAHDRAAREAHAAALKDLFR